MPSKFLLSLALFFLFVVISGSLAKQEDSPCPSLQDEPRSVQLCPVSCFRPDPVCGENGVTYWCGCTEAACAGVRVAKRGFCQVDNGGGTGGTKSASSYPYQLKRSHGILNIIGWGVVLPIGVIIARYCKQWDPLWFYIHGIIQLIGFILGLAGVVAGVALNDKIHANVSTHRGLGISILVLGILQVIAFFLRPDKDSKIRRYWNWYHHWVGRLTLILAIVNIFIGIRVGGAGNSWKTGYTVNIVILFITTVILEILLWTKWSRRSVDIPKY